MTNSEVKISWGKLAAFGTPAVGAGYMYLFLSLYVMKFSTDVLLIAPVVMGLIFSVSRIWDAISDPLVGYLSDRTVTPLGRRRIWLLASVIPISVTFYMVFAPPLELTEGQLDWWMAISIIGFYSSMTLFFVPHMALGAEMTDDYHERNKLFGARHFAYAIGSILSLVSMQLLILAEFGEETDVRALAEELALLAVVVMGVFLIFAVFRLKERPEFQGRMTSTPFSAFKDVWQNGHARLFIVVQFIENVGSAAIAALTLYVMQYVVGAPHLAVLVILTYFVPSSLSVPLWIPLAKKFGKIRIWVISMIGTGVSFGAFCSLPFIDSIDLRIAISFVFAFFAGLAAGCGGMIGPSVQSDIVDYDELVSGERKEGSYFAAWNFVQKSAVGVMLLLTGFVLQFSGFLPNVDQAQEVKIAIVGLYGFFPLVCYLIGAYMFSKFQLDESACNDIRKKLELKRA